MCILCSPKTDTYSMCPVVGIFLLPTTHTHTHTHTHSITDGWCMMPLGSPPLRSFGEDEDEEPDGGSPHCIYDKVEDDPESPYEYVSIHYTL